jgi:hypothetical protein
MVGFSISKLTTIVHPTLTVVDQFPFEMVDGKTKNAGHRNKADHPGIDMTTEIF